MKWNRYLEKKIPFAIQFKVFCWCMKFNLSLNSRISPLIHALVKWLTEFLFCCSTLMYTYFKNIISIPPFPAYLAEMSCTNSLVLHFQPTSSPRGLADMKTEIIVIWDAALGLSLSISLALCVCVCICVCVICLMKNIIRWLYWEYFEVIVKW